MCIKICCLLKSIIDLMLIIYFSFILGKRTSRSKPLGQKHNIQKKVREHKHKMKKLKRKHLNRFRKLNSDFNLLVYKLNTNKFSFNLI